MYTCICVIKRTCCLHFQTFVYENNLYYQSDPLSAPVRLTASGNITVTNGVPDWLYEGNVTNERHTGYTYSSTSRC